MNFFSIDNVAFHVLGYPVSYTELAGTLFGLVSVYYASRANILTWLTGIFNEAFLFILFFQVQLYADTFLQVFFFITTLYGWYQWKRKTVENKISYLNFRGRLITLASLLAGTLLAGFFFSRIHTYMPSFFPVQAAFPYIDSAIMVMSMAATFLLAKKKLENWYLWILTDAIGVAVYAAKHVFFLSMEYFVFLILALYGVYYWRVKMKHE